MTRRRERKRAEAGPLDFFGRAKKAVGGFSAPPPAPTQHYQVFCPEGHSIEGTRGPGYQAIRCPDCGEGVFVLPASPLPEPRIPSDRARRPVKPKPVDLDEPIPLSDAEPQGGYEVAEVDQVEWVDEQESEVEVEVEAESEPPPPPTPAAPVAEFDPDLHVDEPARVPVPKPVSAKPAAPAPAPRPVARPSVAHEPIAVAEPLKARLWRRRNAILGAVVLLAVVGAVSMRLWRQKLSELPKVYERGRTEGLAALDRGDFPAAKEILREAAEAIRLLGGDASDPDVEAVRHGALEAAIYADLDRSSLDELVEKRARANSAEEFASEFDTYHKGQSIVVSADVVEVPDPSRPDSGYQLNYRLGFGGGAVATGRGRIDLKGFRLVEDARPKKGDRLTFGARLAGVDFDIDKNEYVVRLQPESGVFLKHAPALGVLEIGVDEPADGENDK